MSGWLSGEPFSDWRLILKALLLVLLPLLLYLLIPLRAPHTPYLRLPLTPDRELVLYENTLPGFVEFVLGGPFGGSVDLSVDLAAAAGHGLGISLGRGGLARGAAGSGRHRVAGAAGPAGASWRPSPDALLALTGLAFLALVAFNLVYTIGDIFVMYIPVYLVVVLWLAIGVGALARGLAAVLSRLCRASCTLGDTHRCCCSCSFSCRLRWWWPTMRPWIRAGTPAPARAGRPSWPSRCHLGAVLVSDDRNDIMPMWYLQYVDGRRADLLGLFPLITADYATLGEVLDLALSTGRPAYLIKEMPGVEVKVSSSRRGSCGGSWGRRRMGPPASVQEQALADAVILVGHDRAPHSPRPGEELQVSLYWEPLRPLEAEYHTFVHLLDPEGQKVAQSDRQPGGDYYPSNLWRPGERLRDEHLLVDPRRCPAGRLSPAGRHVCPLCRGRPGIAGGAGPGRAGGGQDCGADRSRNRRASPSAPALGTRSSCWAMILTSLEAPVQDAFAGRYAPVARPAAPCRRLYCVCPSLGCAGGNRGPARRPAPGRRLSDLGVG